MKLTVIFCSLICAVSCAHAASDAKPAASNVMGAAYPRVDSENRANFQLKAPSAQKVQVDIGGHKYDMTKEGPVPLGHLNPFARTEAETIAWESGVETAKNDAVGVYVTEISNGDYIKVCSVDFGDKGATKFIANAWPVRRMVERLNFGSTMKPGR